MKLLYNEEGVFALKRIVKSQRTLPLDKLGMVGSRLVSNGLSFSDDKLVDIQLVTFSSLPNVTKLSIEAKNKKR